MWKRRQSEPFQIFTPAGRRIIGRIETTNGRRVLVKQVRREAHFHRVLAAWGIQSSAIAELRRRGVAAVRLVVDDGSVLEAPIDRIDRFGFKREFSPYGKQTFLPEKCWTVVQPPKGQAQQLRLFAAGGEV